MSYRPVVFITIALCSLYLTSSYALSMEEMIEDCEGCHGTNGISECADMPSIGGISAGSHEDAMYAFVDGARPCEASEYRHGDTSRAKTDMCKVAKALSEDEIAQLAEYFAGKEFVAMKQTTDPDKVKAGQEVHDSQCKKCHSDAGSNPEDDAGILAGQPKEYLARVMSEYRAGTRDQPKKMKPKIDALSDEEADALAHFYASQQ